MKLLLASQSSRRKEILLELGYTFDVIPSNIEEVFDKTIPLEEALEKVAYTKAKDVQKEHKDCCIVSADTIVVYDNKVYGKPKSEKQAIQFLKKFSNQEHCVMSGVCILKGNLEITFVEVTKVKFRKLSMDEIQAYVDSKKCMDKAGAYGIQECDFVEKIEGSYSNVVGLPKEKVNKILKELL